MRNKTIMHYHGVAYLAVITQMIRTVLVKLRNKAKQNVINAWNAERTDNDVIIVNGMFGRS